MVSPFPFGTTVYRLRATAVHDPYSDTDKPANWDNPDELPIPGAFVGPTSTSRLGDATREQALEYRSLFCGDFDIQKGDRIRNGPAGSPIYVIDGIPPEPVSSPFTGWTPPREIPLTRAVG